MAKNKSKKGSAGKKIVAWLLLIGMIFSLFTSAIAVLAS
jgi:hypothetical protein